MMTREKIKEFLPSLSDEYVDELLAAANADPDEGAEWLPYYKMACSRLAACCGMLRALVPDDERDGLREAAKLFYQHLLLAGIGPRTDPGVIATAEVIASGAMSSFLDPKRVK